MTTAIKKRSNRGDLVKEVEPMYPVYETDLSVRNDFEELRALPEFQTAACISEFVAQLEELMGCMNPTSYGPTESHLWLVGKIPPKTWQNCRETSERKALTRSYDLIDLLIELAWRERMTLAWASTCASICAGRPPGVKIPGGRSPQPNSNRGKGRGGQSKHMMETPPPANGKGAPNLSYCRPANDKGGPCRAPDCDGRIACMLQVQHKQKTKHCQELKHKDHFRCTMTCGYCGDWQHFEDECHIRRRKSEKHKKGEGERRKNARKGKPEGGGQNPGGFLGKGNPGGGRRSSAAPTGGRGGPNPAPKGKLPGDKRTVPSTPSASGAEKGKNAKKRKLKCHSKCLQAAGGEVKFPGEG